jgi:hypothetical protein
VLTGGLYPVLRHLHLGNHDHAPSPPPLMHKIPSLQPINPNATPINLPATLQDPPSEATEAQPLTTTARALLATLRTIPTLPHLPAWQLRQKINGNGALKPLPTDLSNERWSTDKRGSTNEDASLTTSNGNRAAADIAGDPDPSQAPERPLGNSVLQSAIRLGTVFSPLENGAILHYLSPTPQPVLHSVLFGEGVMDDITAVVLLRVTADMQHVSAVELFHCATRFTALFLTSALAGVVAGLMSAILTKRTPPLPPF